MVFLSSEQLNLIWSGSLVSWILDSNLQQDSGFLVLDSGFQSPGFRIPQAKNSWIPESGFPYMGRSKNYRIVQPELLLNHPDVSLLMKMCRQRKAGRRQRARRLSDLVFNMAAKVMADEYAIFNISSANLEQIIAYHPTHRTQAS